jgi:hypothetical protein
MDIEIRQVGKADGYENYQNEYYLKGELVGHSCYDKKQGLHVGAMVNYHKNFYGKTPQGIAIKMQKVCNQRM